MKTFTYDEVHKATLEYFNGRLSISYFIVVESILA